MNNKIFEDLFVLEMASNHQGSVERGLDIIRSFSKVVRFNNVRAAIKLQFRDISNFIHKDYVGREDIRYVKRVSDTRMSKQDFAVLVDAIRKSGCIPMATPFDEKSVDWCVEFDMPIIKVASADNNDWTLLEKIASTRRPIIVSTGGMTQKDMDDLVLFCEHRAIPLALNHCVAAYPHEDSECELNQIDFLKNRYPGLVIGYSCHEYHDWSSSIQIAYAKGARTFERHVDINDDGFEVATYSSLPSQIDIWFKAWHKAVEMCGTSSTQRRNFLPREIAYLDSYVRGVYAKSDLNIGDLLTEDNCYLAIPLQKGQVSSRELMLGKYGHKMLAPCSKDSPIKIDALDTPYSGNPELLKTFKERGL
ncbi:polysialic acid capsule biosynthesis protein SiaC [Polynucleobacter sp. HIN8]|uniref:N-acetylneuraminate synthase family protein n=1 Tax=Polynucleobacter sp. HIN8 TaxID=3047867 RepID=UPI002574381E|nr:N-acetylneuraminate synthase family protein [Polynucleobacter sp. HIN8]BEI38374.1 polysialic acid capsule biosynthesis protein SiaC [Polynucleobacter sp. HIN8]